jgi:hypothetical protein
METAAAWADVAYRPTNTARVVKEKRIWVWGE